MDIQDINLSDIFRNIFKNDNDETLIFIVAFIFLFLRQKGRSAFGGIDEDFIILIILAFIVLFSLSFNYLRTDGYVE